MNCPLVYRNQWNWETRAYQSWLRWVDLYANLILSVFLSVSVRPLALFPDVVCRQAGIFFGPPNDRPNMSSLTWITGKKMATSCEGMQCVRVRTLWPRCVSLMYCTADELIKAASWLCSHTHTRKRTHAHTHCSQIRSIVGFSHSTSAVSIPPSSCTCTLRPSLFLTASLVFSSSQGPPFIMKSAMLTSMLALVWEN